MALPNPDEACWEYLDPKGFTRGPFAGKTMVAWFDAGMLPAELRVRHSASMAFAPIRELFPAPIPPFRTRPGTKKVEVPKAAMPVAAPAPAPVVQAGPCNCQWLYIDTKGSVQGPFASNQMELWFQHKMLPKDLKLKRSTDSSFATINDFFPKPLIPFKSQPAVPLLFQLQNGPAKQVGPQDGLTNGYPAKAAAPAAAPAPQPTVQPQPKSKAAAKAKGKGGKPGNEEPEADDGKGGKKGKAAGKGDGPIGAANPRTKAQAKQQANAANAAWWQGGSEWTGEGGNDKWWEWSSWNGWSADGQTWEGTEGGKWGGKGGAEWKGADNGNGGPIGAAGTKESKSEKQNATQLQANGFGLKWGPKMEMCDLFPEGSPKRVLDEGIVWEERWVSPLAVRFSQGKIHPFFHERGPISEVLLQIQSSTNSSTGVRHIEPPFPPMRLLHLKPFGVLVTLDNRRLYALQRFAMQEWPTVCLVKALCVEELTPTRLKAENRKFTNRIGGLQIEIESRSNAFDTFSWVTEAGRVEHPRFCRPIAFKAVDKALSLLPILIVHLMITPKMKPLLRSRWPMLQFLASTLRISQRREFPAKRLMLNHVLELAKPNSAAFTCPAVCVAYNMETVVRLSKGKSCLTSNHTIAKPLKLLEEKLLMSPMQKKVLSTLLPFFCLPYARTVLTGETREWVVGFLLAWGKVSLFSLRELPTTEASVTEHAAEL